MPASASPLGFFLARRRRTLAASYTLTISAMTPVGQAGTLTVSPSPSGTVFTGTISFAVTNGSASPASLTFNGSAARTVAITPAATGLVTITPTNNSAYPDPSPATTTGYTPVMASGGDGDDSSLLVPGGITTPGGLSLSPNSISVHGGGSHGGGGGGGGTPATPIPPLLAGGGMITAIQPILAY